MAGLSPVEEHRAFDLRGVADHGLRADVDLTADVGAVAHFGLWTDVAGALNIGGRLNDGPLRNVNAPFDDGRRRDLAMDERLVFDTKLVEQGAEPDRKPLPNHGKSVGFEAAAAMQTSRQIDTAAQH